jgi:hypothetical protein
MGSDVTSLQTCTNIMLSNHALSKLRGCAVIVATNLTNSFIWFPTTTVATAYYSIPQQFRQNITHT